MRKAERLSLALPNDVAALLSTVDVLQRHPGLQLDKFSPFENQEAQKHQIANVCKADGARDLLLTLSKRRAAKLAMLRAESFRASTAGPLTLHLARASGLENAGIHLHPVYGFACLPGSGLKGMARAWAETVWLADQADPVAAWDDIRAVFGRAPRSEEGKHWKPEGADELEGASAGSVVFHDAWPTDWPRLEPDIVNNHHKKYYEGEDDPGDWDKPEMAYFLSVAAGTEFEFALSPRMADDGDGLRHVALAREWLQAASVYDGAGAKTNAGYGRFRLDTQVPGAARQVSDHVLELTTPAFLAGAQQQKEDCDLRSATLRGHLRWWWRTMHAARLSREDLRRLETAIWGDAKAGAALSLFIRRDTAFEPQRFDKDRITKRHCERNSQGIRYAAYGMDERKRGKRYQRWYVEPGARWTLTFSARRGFIPENGPFIEAADILRQGQLALWMLCRYGGVGSKARNGFGSFADVEIDAVGSIRDCKDAGERLHKSVGLTGRRIDWPKSSSLDSMLDVLEIATPWHESWFALDQLGGAMQSFARMNKHDERKAALGLPRKIHGPRDHPMKHQDHERHQPPKSLRSANGHWRLAAPVHYHFAPNADGAMVMRMTVFPSPALLDIKIGRKVLTKLRSYMAADLEKRANAHSNRGRKRPTARLPPGPADDRSTVRLPRPGERVEALLLDEKTKKGGWKAKHEPTGLQGPLQNSGEGPDDAVAGQRVQLVVASANPRVICFNWPTPEIEARLRSKQSGGSKRRGGGSRRPSRGWR